MSRVLVVNTGSSSLKLTVDGAEGLSAHIAGWDGHDVMPIRELAAQAGRVDAVGHRVVHGGAGMTAPTVIDEEVRDSIEALTPLAPLHQGRAVAGITAAQVALPELPHVACFDTAFHATLPAEARTYALPEAWREAWGLQRFGFHGLSHAYVVRRAAELVGRANDPALRVVSCHLGAGASLCAARGGRSVDTTMGFTPLEGLVMATRSGSVDPGLVLWLLTEAGLTPAEVNDGLVHDSGIAGLAGTPDMKAVVERDDDRARLAFAVYVHRLCREIAAMTASLGGIDVLVFTGGVGEHSSEVRNAATDRVAYLGAFTTLVIEAREDIEIARQVRGLLGL